MTKTEFFTLCTKYEIEPCIALESVNLIEALKDRDSKEVERILKEEF